MAFCLWFGLSVANTAIANNTKPQINNSDVPAITENKGTEVNSSTISDLQLQAVKEMSKEQKKIVLHTLLDEADENTIIEYITKK